MSNEQNGQPLISNTIENSKQTKALLRLIRDKKFFLGIAFLLASAVAYLIATNTQHQPVPYVEFTLKLIAIFFAEFGAVFLSMSYLHLTYEDYQRDQHLRDFANTMRQVLQGEIRSSENSRAFVQEARKILIESGARDQESYSKVRDFGIRTVYEKLDTREVKDRLRNATRIHVMKTWFPDHQDIEEGLKDALANPDVKVKLLLSDDEELLRLRSIGAGYETDPKHGLRQVEKTLFDIYNGAKGTFEIALYRGWPGCPVIWHGEERLRHALLGFYFRGKSSPYWPWIEIDIDSPFDKILRKQFDDLWAISSKISNREELSEWLEKRRELRGQIESEPIEGTSPVDAATNSLPDEEKP